MSEPSSARGDRSSSAWSLRHPAAAVLVLVLASAGGSPRTPAAQEADLDAHAALIQLADEWAEPRSSRRIADVSLAGLESEADFARAMSDRLAAIPTLDLTPDDQITRAVLQWQIDATLDDLELYWYLSALMPAVTPLRPAFAIVASTSVARAEDAESYLSFLDECVDGLQASLAMERGRAARAIVLPDEQIDRILPFWRRFAATGPDNPLWLPAAQHADLDEEQTAGFVRQMSRTIDGPIVRVASRIVDHLDRVSRPRAPNAVGMGQYPGGKHAYRIATRMMTSLDVTPEQVHRIGLDAVDDINEQMAAVRAQLGFTGSKAEFHERLRRDPRFYVETPEQFGAALLAYDAKIRPRIFEFFLREPEAPYSVRRVDPALEASLTYGYYNQPTDDDPHGYYNYNGSALSQRSLLSGAALTYHELVPGHHFQIQLARENEDLPTFRKNAYFPGYGEGWGEYSSSVVAREMGMYDDPYDLYGRLVFDMFFAVRLVVDTGMNYYGWSRPRAMLYMREHTMESDVQIDSETIRYSMRSPAQALAYRMGRDTWLRLRRHAETELGDAFDVRAFHDSVLGIGSVPLVVLEEHVTRWIHSVRHP